MSTGNVLMFFEPHCIVQAGWLDALLLTLAGRPNSIVMPVFLDSIPAHDFSAYYESQPGFFRMEWNFNLQHTNLVREFGRVAARRR